MDVVGTNNLFLILGFIFKSTAEKQKGVSVSAGAIINGEYVETDSGRMGANYEKYNSLMMEELYFTF